MKKPEISIVMATYNRADLLIKQLLAFESQTLNKDLFEVVIVNDGSTDRTKNLLDLWSRKFINLNVIHKQNGGPAKARNTGVYHSLGKIIAFTDDDCIVDGDWLENIHRVFNQRKDIQVIEGLTYTEKENRTPLTHQIENLTWNPVIPTCNAAYRKEFFARMGGFDTDFPYAHNEDTDLAWRVLEETEVLFCEEVKVYHPPIPVRFFSQLKRMRMLKSEFLLFKKNKEAYQKWRTEHPWVTIYSEVFFKHQLLNLKFHLGFFRKPKLMLQGILLSLGWWCYLLLLFPEYLHESRKISEVTQ